MPRRWRPPPSWPPPPHRNWSPPPGWRPDPTWPPPPPGWQFWQDEPSRAWIAVPAAVLGVLAIGVAGSLGDDGEPLTTSPVLVEETVTPSVPTTPTAAPALAPATVRTTTAAPRTTAPKRTAAPARTATKAPEPTTARPEPKPRRTATKAPSGDCDANYAGACVPIASDVDCGSGSGNGPEYLHGTARVVGEDVYGLDRDNDGVACEQG